MEKLRGIVGLTQAFRDAVSDLREGSKIVFVGSPYVCPPFVELLAYAVRDKNFEMLFIPKANESEARRIRELKNIGYCISNEKANPSDPEAVVLLGGLAMPKFGCSAEEVSAMVKRLSKMKSPIILGVCFMSIFKKQGWDRTFSFKRLIDATVEVEIV
ncbi:MAG: DUF2124 family protein [Archaeoglobales archaeon]|nr:DUF2124 family protein [Archaeoglobales archaeon]